MNPAEAAALKTAILWIGTPIMVAFVGALAAHLIMVFKLPGKLDRVTDALEDETLERKKEMERLREILDEIRRVLSDHSGRLRDHGERIAAAEARSGSA